MTSNKLQSYYHFLFLHVILSFFIISFWCLSSISPINASQIIFNNETRRAYESELHSLLTWKDSLDKQSQETLASWNPNHPHCSGNWSGISCNKAGRVAGINLDSYGLRGTLHHFNFSSFAHLINITLGNNSLYGTIPSNISVLSKLVYLELGSNMLSGVIPEEIRMLSLLSSLNLAANNLSGIIPDGIGECRQLLNLNLSCNTFDGHIPLQIGNILSLQNLDLSHNKLSGGIPQELAQLRILQSLNLSHNNISGRLPSSLQNCVSLTTIDISNNQLEGPLPNIPAFQKAGFDSLKNNNGLCGHIDGLTPCSSKDQRKKINKVILIIGVFIGIFGVFVLLVAKGRKLSQLLIH